MNEQSEVPISMRRVVEAFDKGFRKTKMYRPESSQKSKKAS